MTDYFFSSLSFVQWFIESIPLIASLVLKNILFYLNARPSSLGVLFWLDLYYLFENGPLNSFYQLEGSILCVFNRISSELCRRWR